jgi:plasmid stabilization system protein ParE
VAKKYKVNISCKAQKDLEHIFYYIAEDSMNNARNFILELEEKINNLHSMPERFALIPENIFFGTNYRQITHKKYRVIYKISSSSVFIMRIVHGTKLIDL